MGTSVADPDNRPILAFGIPSFRFFWITTLCASFAAQIMSVAIGWQIYDDTRNPLFLGLVGLAHFLPALSLVLVTGLVADRFPRRRIIFICMMVELAAAIGLLTIAISGDRHIWPIFALIVTLGTARAFIGPAGASLAPNLVPPEALSNAVSMNATAWQLASILGPVAGGLLYGLGNVVLGAISLDLFAVLMGGAVALMPVFARDILDVGPWGLGLLRAAPGIGAIAMALWLARFPIRDNAGIILFVFVAAFGFFTLCFGLSTSVWLSIPLLALLGACDMVSVSIRETIMQLWTPDTVRGRVNAVNSVFIGASNELGEFRAGVMATFIGAQAAVVFGGAATMAVAGIWSQTFSGLRSQKAIDRKMVEG
ncbi:MAG TPA: MFS transporter [Devosia sp.]|nr:MFS transporter [Devosia sp.]